MAAARAVATALVYRYMGVNTGYGAAGRAVHDASTAIAKHDTPTHVVQVVLAEWLYVFAALAAEAAEADDDDVVGETSAGVAARVGVVSGLKADADIFKDVAVVLNSPVDVLTRPDVVADGTHFPSLSCVLVYLADWLGAVLPVYKTLTRGDVRSVVSVLMPRVHALRVTDMPPSCLAARLLRRGLAMSDEVFITHVQRFLHAGRSHVPHASTLVVTRARDAERKWGPASVAASTSACPSIATAIDAASSYAALYTQAVPTSMVVLPDDVDALLSSGLVCVVTGGGKWFPVLAFELTDAALEYMVVDAATATLVNALSPQASETDYIETRSRACNLFYTANQKTVVNSVRTAFLTRFPSVALRLGRRDVQTEGDSRQTHAKTETATETATATVTVKDKTTTTTKQPTLATPQASAQPAGVAKPSIVVRPGRHVHKEGGSMLSLYYTPEVWTGFQKALQTVTAFFKRHEVLRTATGQTYFVSTRQDGAFTASCELVKDGTVYVGRSIKGRNGADVVDDTVIMNPTDATKLAEAPYWSVVLMREDLLALAIGGANRAGRAAQYALAELWTRHVQGLDGRRFKDSITHELLQTVLDGKDARVLGGARWAPGAMAELVFGFWDVTETLDNLKLLDDFLSTTRVVQHDGATLSSGRVGPHGVTVLSQFVVDGDDLVLERNKGTYTLVRYNEIAAWSEPLLRGLCITTTQACIFDAFGTVSEREALRSIVNACKPEDVNAEMLFMVTLKDKQELQFYHDKADTDTDTVKDTDTIKSTTTSTTTPSSLQHPSDSVSQATLVPVS
jgi:hypothetical protein